MTEIIQRQATGPIYLKRGCKLPAPGAMKLKFGDYLNRPQLPVVPKVFGHLKAAAPPGGWGILGNATYGCCVMSGAGHETMLYAWATGRPIPPFTSASIVKQYLERTGGEDVGLEPVATARWRQQSGLTDAAGVVHKIDAFVQINNLDELDLAVYLFGVAGFCWQLSPTAEDQFAAGHVWDDLSQDPDPNAGHYTPCGGKNSAGLYEFLTWAKIEGATRDYTEKYGYTGNGMIAMLSREYLLETGQSPESIKWADLNADLQAIS